VSINFLGTKDNIKISVTDDGEGMDYKTVTTVWMVPSTSYKQVLLQSSKKKRALQGRKGIGRYASSILGDQLYLETVKGKELTTLTLDWKEFEKKKYLDEVKVSIQKEATKRKPGTTIEIIGDKNKLIEWDSLQIEKLIKDLRRLVSPVHGKDTKSDFKIEVSFKNLPIQEYNNEKILIEPFPILDVFDYRIHGEVSEAGEANLTFQNGIAGTPPEKIPKIKISLDKGAKYCGLLSIDFKIYDRDTESVRGLIKRMDNKGVNFKASEKLKRAEVRSLLNEICGIGVYRTGFRVRPHGDPGYDWLLLDRRRVQMPGRRVGSDRVSGFIEIEPEETSHLEEKANREGLKENKYYDGLVQIVTRVLLEAENRRYQFKLKTGKERSQKGLTEKLDNLFDFSEVTQSIDRELADRNIPETERKKIVGLIDARVEESNKVIEDVKRIIAIYQGQATLGKIVRVVLHEGRNPLSYFQNQIPLMEKWSRELKKNYSKSIITQFIGGLGTLQKQVQFLVNLFKKISPLAAQRRPSPTTFFVKKNLQEIISIFDTEFKLKKINIKLNCKEDVTTTAWPEDFSQTFVNLLDNSLYWFSHSDEKKKEVNITVETNSGEIKIIYQDNGPGIEEKFIQDELIFEPGFSTKPDGTGLGLAIAGEAMERNNGKLTAIYSESGALFEIYLPATLENKL
jgi:signal transduction histidine kinase